MKIFYVVKKELIEFFRQKEFLPIIFIMPIVQIVIFGYVMTTDIKRLPVQIVNLSDSMVARDIISRIQATPLFDVRPISRQPVNALEILNKGRVKAVIIFRNAFDRKKSFLRYPEIQILLDGIDANTSQIAAGYFNGIMQHYLLQDISRKGRDLPIQSKGIIRFNPRLRSINYMGPGLVTILLTSLLLFIGAISLVREKEQQTVDTLLISPLSALEIYIGKAIPVALLSLASMSVGMLTIIFWFRISFRGNLGYLLLAISIYMAAVLAYAMMISTFASSQQEAMFFAWFSMISFLLLSGFFTPAENMPLWLRILSRADPAYYMMRIIREIFLKGNGIVFFWQELLALSAITLVIVALSLLNYRRLILK